MDMKTDNAEITSANKTQKPLKSLCLSGDLISNFHYHHNKKVKIPKNHKINE